MGDLWNHSVSISIFWEVAMKSVIKAAGDAGVEAN